MGTSSIHLVIVVLDLRQESVPAFIDRVTTILNSMAANTVTFPSPVPTLAKATSDLAALSAAQAAFKAHTASRTDRDDAVKVVIAAMSQLHAYVEALANGDREQAATIAGDAAMTLRTQRLHHKEALAVKQTVSGSVNVIAKAIQGGKSNDWQFSTDGGKTWLDIPSTTRAHTTIHDHARHRRVLPPPRPHEGWCERLEPAHLGAADVTRR